MQQFLYRIAWHQIYHSIIKVQRVKIGNILSEVIKQWRPQAIIQVTWEKEVVFDDSIITKYARRNSRGMALDLPVSTISGRIPHLNFARADLWALLITNSTSGFVRHSSLYRIYVLNFGTHATVFFQLLQYSSCKVEQTKFNSMIFNEKIFTIQTTEYTICIFAPAPFQLFVPVEYLFHKPAVIHCNQFIP